ncbi:hypothetical protein [Kerstersia similis]|uniref:hypothetical protein n=1 Tax=Kerstersia similis TaxID=206505 RepID=UPI0039EFE5BD
MNIPLGITLAISRGNDEKSIHQMNISRRLQRLTLNQDKTARATPPTIVRMATHAPGSLFPAIGTKTQKNMCAWNQKLSYLLRVIEIQFSIVRIFPTWSENH